MIFQIPGQAKQTLGCPKEAENWIKFYFRGCSIFSSLSKIRADLSWFLGVEKQPAGIDVTNQKLSFLNRELVQIRFVFCEGGDGIPREFPAINIMELWDGLGWKGL